MSTDFENVYHGLNPLPGKLRLAAGGIGWKQNEGGEKPVTVSAADMRHGEWIRVARNFQIKLHLSRGEKDSMTFDGFAREDFERVQNLFKNNYSVAIDSKETALRGWNWGKADVNGADLSFSIAGRPAFTLPVDQLHNTSISKTEVIMEFTPPNFEDLKGKRQPDQLIEMRVYIPGSESRARKKAKKAERQAEKAETKPKKEEGDESKAESESEVDTDDVSSDEGEHGEASAAQVFHESIKDRGAVGALSGESIMSFNEVHLAVPRGRYEIELCNGFLRVRNKSYDYKIPFTAIKRLFLLPKNDDVNVQLAIHVDPGLRQGQTKYSYIVMQFPRDEHMEAEPNLDDASVKEKFPNLEDKYDDPAYTVMSNVLKAVSGKKVLTPSPNFHTKADAQAIKCNLRANEGQLYMLEKSMIFMARQPLLISFRDIKVAHFERIAGAMVSSRTVDLRLERDGESDITLSALNKDDHPLIADFLESKNVTVSNEVMDDMMGTSQAVAAAMMDVSDDDADSDDSAAAERRKLPKGNIAQMDMDEGSDVDEDFKANSDESDVAEEFDENYTSAEESETEKPAKKKKKTSD